VDSFTLQTSPHQHGGIFTSFSFTLSKDAFFHLCGMSSWLAHGGLVMEPDEAMPTTIKDVKSKYEHIDM
jgi:hypothetical protein